MKQEHNMQLITNKVQANGTKTFVPTQPYDYAELINRFDELTREQIIEFIKAILKRNDK